MNREQAREEIRHRAKEWLTPDKSGKGYICPICGSGSGRNGTGITTADGIHFTCWAGCFSSADIIDIIGLKNGLACTGVSLLVYLVYSIQDSREQHITEGQI